MKKKYQVVYIVSEGDRFWTKEFVAYQFDNYQSAFADVVDKFKFYPEITNGVIYSNKGTAISLTRNILPPVLQLHFQKPEDGK